MSRSLLVLAALLAFPAAASAQHGKVAWVEDADRGMEEARKSGKNAFLYFGANW